MKDSVESHVQVVWCDDIRQEIGGKLSFMGVYAGGLVIPVEAIVLPQLYVWVQLHSPLSKPITEIVARIIQDDGSVVVESKADGVVPPEMVAKSDPRKTMHTVGMIFQIAPFAISPKCQYFEVVVTQNSETELRGRKLWISRTVSERIQATLSQQ